MPSAKAASPETPRKRKRSQKETDSPKTESKRQKSVENPSDQINGTQDNVVLASTSNDIPATSQLLETVANGSELPYEKRHKVERRRKQKQKWLSQPTDQLSNTLRDAGAVEGAGKDRKEKKDRKQRQKESAEWDMTGRDGGRLLHQDPVFSSDEKYLFVATSMAAQVLSIDTSLGERSLPVSKSRSEITAIAASLEHPDHIYLASSSGIVERRDWTTGEARKESLELPGLTSKLAIALDADSDVVYSIGRHDDSWHIRRGIQVVYTSNNPLRELDVLEDYVIATGNDNIIVGTSSRGTADKGSLHTFTEIPVSAQITCLAARLLDTTISKPKGKPVPRKTLAVAVGCKSGEIFVYDDVVSMMKTSSISPRVLHWHREAVGSIKWSTDGSYLISGGGETVLVIWQLQTGKKQFLPHLTAEIERLVVSPSGSAYALQLADNSVMVLSTSELKPIANFAGLQSQYHSRQEGDGRLGTQDVGVKQKASLQNAVEPATASTLHPMRAHELLLAVPHSSMHNAGDGRLQSRPFLQTYDMQAKRHIARQALTRNNVTDFNKGPEDNRIEEPDVVFTQISHDGEWLATVEHWEPSPSDVAFLAANARADEEQRHYRREVYLKFWRWNEDKKHWMLETRIDSPHHHGESTKSGRVFALKVDPAETGFATIGEDSCVRIWKPKTRLRNGNVIRGSSNRGLVEWSCRFTIQLEQGPEPLEEQTFPGIVSAAENACLAYSEDGSTLAACQRFQPDVAAPAVHFINTETGEIAQTRGGLFSGTLSALGFLNRHIIALSASSLSVWDVVDETLQYRVDLSAPDAALAAPHRPNLLAINSDNKSFAVATPWLKHKKPATRVQIHGTETAKPSYQRDLSGVVTALLATTGRREYTLLTSAAEIMHIYPRSSAAAAGLLPLPATAGDHTALATVTRVVDEDMEAPFSDDGEQQQQGGRQRIADFEDVDSEKPVVRPEQLARVFDVGQGFALMPVKAMFEAVVGLYGRKRAAVAT